MVVVFDHDLRYVSAAGSDLPEMGLTAEALVGQTIFELFTPEIVAAIEPLYREVLVGEEASRDVQFAGRIYLSRLTPVRDVDGAVVGGMGFTEEVTAARASEGALRESEERFRVAFENAPAAKVLISLEGRFEQVNQAMCVMTRYSPRELLALTVADLTHPEDLAATTVAVNKLLAGNMTAYTLEKRYLTKPGDVLTVTESASLMRSADGSPLYLITWIQDITERKEHEYVLAEERRRLREAQAIGRQGSWELDIETTAVTWSDTLFELYGLAREDFGGDFAAALECVHPDDRHQVAAAIETGARTSEPFRVSYRVTRPVDGELRNFDAHGQRLSEEGQGDRLVGVVTDVTDITKQILAEAEERGANAFQAAVIQASPDIIYVRDVTTHKTVWSNRSVAQELGYASEDLNDIGGDILSGLVPEEDQILFRAGMLSAQSAKDNEVVQLNHRLRHSDGGLRWFSQRGTPLHRDQQGRVTQIVGAMRDITEGMDLQNRIEHSSLHDPLTGLPNRALLIDRLTAALSRSVRDRREVAVLYCDLDGFKRVNDTAGHAAGDAVLLETSRRLHGLLREGDTVARVGGDEFVVIVEPWNRADSPSQAPGGDRELAVLIAQRIVASVRQPVTVNGVEHVLSASVGITYGILPPSGHVRPTTADEVLQNADAAMYRAKGLGKDRFEVFQQTMRVDLTERGRVERTLRVALQRASGPSRGPAVPHPGQVFPLLVAAYQPVFDSLSGTLVSFEALARLTDADGLEVAPDLFISVAEERGIIVPLGVYMLELASEQLATWREQIPGMRAVTMAVNVSALQAQHPSLGESVRRILATHGLVSSDLILELTETALLHADRSTIANLHDLRDEGVGIAIDDFGTGYASLRYLATLPVSGVKVDKSFTAGLPTDGTSSKIVRAVAGLAADMGLTCVVEGVETLQQREALPSGVQLQGWLTGRPEKPDSLNLGGLVAHGVS
jgi:diguanylate cyclase (GGDEF)-like protein/PAS domain S-box-containing protein